MPPAPTPRRLQRKTELAKQRKRAERGRRLPDLVEDALQARAAGRCELCGDPMPRCHRHHRKLRSQGGRDDVTNLVLVHPNCHNTIHNNDEWSRANGFIVGATRNPATVPVLLHGGRTVRLAADGSYYPVAAA